MASTQSTQPIEITVTESAVETGGNTWPLRGVDQVHVREGTDFTLPLLEIVAATVLMMGGVGLGLVGESLLWAALTCLPGIALAALAVHRALSGNPLYSLVLRRVNSEEVVCFSPDRLQLEAVAARVRPALSK